MAHGWNVRLGLQGSVHDRGAARPAEGIRLHDDRHSDLRRLGYWRRGCLALRGHQDGRRRDEGAERGRDRQ